MAQMNIQRRQAAWGSEAMLAKKYPQLLARLFANRGVGALQQVDYALENLHPPKFLGMEAAVALLVDAIEQQKSIVILADYDCDGATACALAVEALRSFGADSVHYLVPNRQQHGYGLTPAIARLAAEMFHPDVLITVDNGIASIEGVAEARRLGMQVLITDHHLPGPGLPQAEAIINPNQPGCPFPSKCIAGVGVIFYVMTALRTALRERGYFHSHPEPPLAPLLDMVALGTIADVVTLDHNNRLLVHHGLQRMRQGRARPGILAMFHLQQRNPAMAATSDISFQLAPLLNAAGRLADMGQGIAHLLARDMTTALRGISELLALNHERKERQKTMVMQADELLGKIAIEDLARMPGIVLYQAGWHQGLVGILAGRLKDRLHRPVIVFGDGEDGELRGSGRSPAGIHLRDILDWISKHSPQLMRRFGGHDAAAGLTLHADSLEEFRRKFIEGIVAMSPNGLASHTDISDGSLEESCANVLHARLLREQVWGAGFPEPAFDDVFTLKKQSVVGEHHLKMLLTRQGRHFEAIQFNFPHPAPDRLHALYRLSLNQYQGHESVQLIVENMQPI